MEKQFSPDPAPDVRAEFRSASPRCGHCPNPRVDVLIMKNDVIWWWCALCGHVWGQPQRLQGAVASDSRGSECV
jgi:hypothetical protein